MIKKVRGHTAAPNRPSKSRHHEAKAKKTLTRRPQTSLGFDRDSPDVTNFLTQNLSSRPKGQTPIPREKSTEKVPGTARKIKPFGKAFNVEEKEQIWEKLRFPETKKKSNGNYQKENSRKIERGDFNARDRPKSSSKVSESRKIVSTQIKSEARSSPPRRRIVKAWSAPDSLKKEKRPKIKARLSDANKLDVSYTGSLVKDNKGNGIAQKSPSKLEDRNGLLAIEPLNSIIEDDDINRYIEDEEPNDLNRLENSFAHVSVDELLLSDIDDSHYDTDLEDEFPEPPPKEYDPTEKRTYVESCLSQGVIPVTYLLKRLGDKEVTMRHHGLGPHGTKPLTNALLKNTCIEELDLTDNDIQAEGGMLFALTLYENLYITSLDLSENFLRVEGGISLAKVLLSNTSLTKLVLKGNHFTDKVAKAFAEMLKDNRTLKHLDLSYNEFGELGGLYLGAGLGLNYGLQTLNLSWNSIRNKGAVSMAAALKTNESLKCLNLSWNGLAFVGALAFARHLKKNETLEDLDISNNRIGPKGAVRLSGALKINTGIQYFRIGLNPIGDEGVHAILGAAKQNMNIKFLGLEDITVSPRIHDEILKLESERDIIILTGGKTGHAQEKPPPSGMEILVQFIQDNRMRLKDLFFQFDKDHSGDISREEFKSGLKETGIEMSERQLDALIESIDVDKSNTIEYSEILYGREAVMKERRFKKKVAIRTEQREKESIRLPKLEGFQE